MTLNEYQELAERTINKGLMPQETEMHALHGLASEVGEIHGIFQKFYQGHEIDAGELRKEVGEENIEKLRKRYPEGFDAERSLHREE